MTRHSRHDAVLRPSGRAFTALEVLITVLIIGILALLMIPTLSRRARDARERAAERDLYELREALTRAAIDTGYYYPQHILDDVVSEGQTWPAHDGIVDSILFEDTQLTDPGFARVNNARLKVIFISPTTGDFLTENQCEAFFDRMTAANIAGASVDARKEAVERFGFRGPYVTWNRDQDRDDMQEDPWGNAYLFFTERGLIWEYNAPPHTSPREIQHELVEDWDVTSYSNIDDGVDPPAVATDIFDRPILLSMGPDGVPGSSDTGYEFGTGDDIFISFD